MARKPTPAALPAGMPVLGRGRHRSPDRGACFLEYTALLAGEPFSDEPACVDRELAAVLRHANDVLGDADRSRLVPLLGRTVGLVLPPPAGPPPDPALADPAADEVWRAVVLPHARRTVALHRAVSARFTAALGVALTADEQRACDGGREVGRLFWSLLDRPEPARTPAAWVDRLVARLELLHTCYEQALAGPLPGADLPAPREAQSAGPAARVTVAECAAPSVPVQVTVTR
jgi:hypothetical protein